MKARIRFLTLVAAGASFLAQASPIWNPNPIQLPDVLAGTACSVDLSPYILSSREGIVFAKISGPAWSVVSSEGYLMGVPASQDAGVNSMLVRACDTNNECADATVTLSVK